MLDLKAIIWLENYLEKVCELANHSILTWIKWW